MFGSVCDLIIYLCWWPHIFLWCDFVMYLRYNMLIVWLLNAYVYYNITVKIHPSACHRRQACAADHTRHRSVTSREWLRLLAVLERVGDTEATNKTQTPPHVLEVYVEFQWGCVSLLIELHGPREPTYLSPPTPPGDRAWTTVHWIDIYIYIYNITNIT